MGHPLEKLYPLAPVWAQNIGISLFGLGWRRKRLGGEFPRYVAGFRERDRWSPIQMQEHVAANLQRVLLQAAGLSPGTAPCSPCLLAVPVYP